MGLKRAAEDNHSDFIKGEFMIDCVCRFPGVSSEVYQFVAVPRIGDTVMLHCAGKNAVPAVVEDCEFSGITYPEGYIDTSTEPSVVLILRKTE